MAKLVQCPCGRSFYVGSYQQGQCFKCGRLHSGGISSGVRGRLMFKALSFAVLAVAFVTMSPAASGLSFGPVIGILGFAALGIWVASRL